MRDRFQSVGACPTAFIAGLMLLAAAFPASARQVVNDKTETSPRRAEDRPAYLVHPNWATPPRAVFPAQALAAGITDGRAVIDCAVQVDGTLADCGVKSETPGNLGLGEAALAAAAQARVALGDGDAMPSARLTYVARFLAPAPAVRIESSPVAVIVPAPPPLSPSPPPPRPSLVTSPSWSRAPRPEIPRRALERGLTSGLVGASCAVNPNGTLTSCRVLYEEHPGVGFGAAALTSLTRARLSPRTVDGAAHDARVLIWIPVVNQ